MRKIGVLGLFLCICCSAASSQTATRSEPRSKSYDNTRRLLCKLRGSEKEQDALAVLFMSGDRRIGDLVRLLSDRDEINSLSAQKVIRYLGNKQGMQGLFEWYRKQQGEYSIRGPIPIPLAEWDYGTIDHSIKNAPAKSWGDWEVEYLYALVLDGSERASTVLQGLLTLARNVEVSPIINEAIGRISAIGNMRSIGNPRHIAKAVLEHSPFLRPGDRRYASSKLLAFNAAKDKALVLIDINRGELSAEAYHVVLMRKGRNWFFNSVHQISVS